MSKSKKTPEQEEETKGKAPAAPEEDPKPAEETPKDNPSEEKPEDCAPVVAATLEINCNWQDNPRQVLDAERRLIQLGGVALFAGDIAPTVDVLAGTVEIYGAKWNIHKGTKCRNPDGTVNYTKLELM